MIPVGNTCERVEVERVMRDTGGGRARVTVTNTIECPPVSLHRMLPRPRLLNHLKPLHPSLTSHLPTLSRSLATMTTPPQLADGGETDHGLPLQGKRAQLVQDVMALFQSKPTLEIFQRGWRQDAVFEDPIAIATGFKQYAA